MYTCGGAGIFLHVLADTLGSVGVVISTLLIKYKGWVISDPVPTCLTPPPASAPGLLPTHIAMGGMQACSIFISLLIVSSVIPLLRNSAEVRAGCKRRHIFCAASYRTSSLIADR